MRGHGTRRALLLFGVSSVCVLTHGGSLFSSEESLQLVQPVQLKCICILCCTRTTSHNPHALQDDAHSIVGSVSAGVHEIAPNGRSQHSGRQADWRYPFLHANRILQTCKHSQPVALTEKGIHGDADRRTYTYKATTNVDGLNESDGGTPRSASDQNHGSPKAVTGKHGGRASGRRRL